MGLLGRMGIYIIVVEDSGGGPLRSLQMAHTVGLTAARKSSKRLCNVDPIAARTTSL
jgi:hypothetical protein